MVMCVDQHDHVNCVVPKAQHFYISGISTVLQERHKRDFK